MTGKTVDGAKGSPLRRRMIDQMRIAELLALKEVHAEDIPPDLFDLMTGGPVAGCEFERHILRYIVERMNLTPHLLEASLRRTKPDRWEALMGTVAEAWLEQGRTEGIEKGRAEGRAEGREEGRAEVLARFLLRQLELRFRDVPGTVRDRVRAASAAELEAWAEAALVAESLDEVLSAGP